MDTTTTTTPPPASATGRLDPADPALGPLVRRKVAARHVGVLATASGSARPHAAAVLYDLAEGAIWISTLRESRKARNAAAIGRAALTVAVRRLPVGPPASVQLSGPVEVLDLDHPDLVRLAADGAIDGVTGHGELELAGGCILRLTPGARVPTYGLGMGLWTLLRDPLDAARTAHVDW